VSNYTERDKRITIDTQRFYKVKVKVVLEQATKAERGNRVIALIFNLGARWRWVVNATLWPLYPRERPGTHSIGGWVGPRGGLDGCGKSCPPPAIDSRTVQPFTASLIMTPRGRNTEL